MEKNKSIVIIGSGLGGLVCGAILAREGYKITVLEMNKQIGGTLQAYARDKHLFDSGVHYIGGLDKGQNLYKAFKYLGIIDKLKLQKMDESAFDKIYFASDNKTYSFAQGYENFERTLTEAFPEEEKAIKTYCSYIQKVCSHFPLYNIRSGDYSEKSEFTEIDTKAYIDSITDNQRLRDVLVGNNMLYSGIPDRTPIYIHALIINSYIESSYRMLNGGSQIAKELHRKIMEHGGEVINHTRVKKLETKDSKVIYAESDKGKRFYADYFISNIHPAITIEMITGEGIRNSYKNRITGLKNSPSMFILNVTLKPGMFRHENSNYYCFTQDKVWDALNYTEETWPICYVMFFSAKKKHTAFADGITLMAYMKMEEVDKWTGSYNTVGKPGDRGEGYAEFKRKKAEKIIDAANKRFPGLKNAVLNYYASTPLTFRDYMGTDDGSIYGIEKDYRSPFKSIISPKTKIENLLLTGQNLNLHGVLGVTISSLVTCSTFLGLENLIQKIEAAQDE